MSEENYGQTAGVEVFTPERAETILAIWNQRNRPLREAKARQIANGIAHGRWRLNGETIIFGRSGHLLTGQHRLRACVISGIPIRSWVVRGVDDSAFNTVDQGDKKTSGDILAIAGEKNGNALAAVARWHAQVNTGVFASYAPSPTEVEEVLARRPSIRKWVARARGTKNGKRMFPAHLVAVLDAAAEKYGDAVVEVFFEQVSTGIGLTKGSPALLLRERLLEQSAHKTTAPRVMTAMAIKAISAHCTGKEKMAFLRWRADDEAWPKL